VGASHGERSPRRSGSGFDRIGLVRSADRREAGPGRTPGGVLKASCGSSGRARRGANWPQDTVALRPAGAGSDNEKRPGCSWRCGGPSSMSSTTAKRSAGMSALWMAASLRRKRGRQNRPNQTGQGHKVDGTGRWRRYSAGSIPGRGVPGGGHTPRTDARESADPGQAATADCRSRLRQQRRAAPPRAAPHSADHPGPPQQYSGHGPRRPLPPPLSAPLDRRAHDRLTRQLPSAHRAL
jgi:hypothetical protein